MNKDYWIKFYKYFHLKTPSDFAHFCLTYMPKKAKIIDVGCGTGRDSYFFGAHGHTVLGIDYAVKPRDKDNVLFHKVNMDDIVKYDNNGFNVVYSRFLLHSITNDEIVALLEWTKHLFMAEFRVKGDVPVLYPYHGRNLIDLESLFNALDRMKFKTVYWVKGKGLAKFKGEDPLIGRVIAKK